MALTALIARIAGIEVPAIICGNCGNEGDYGNVLLGEALVDFGEGELDLLFADRVLGRFRLPLQVRLREPKRLELAYFLWIDLRPAAAAPAPLRFTFLDLFLDSRFRVYQAFSGITHKSCWTLSPGSWRPAVALEPIHCAPLSAEGQRKLLK
jgi:hypothetical protein